MLWRSGKSKATNDDFSMPVEAGIKQLSDAYKNCDGTFISIDKHSAAFEVVQHVFSRNPQIFGNRKLEQTPGHHTKYNIKCADVKLVIQAAELR